MARIDTLSDTWAEVSGWASSELQRARDLLESEATDPADTPAIRARIKLLKRLLELPGKVDPETEPEVAFGIEPPTSES